MVKFGLIFGAVSFFLAVLSGNNLVCSVCFPLVIALSTGLLAAREERPITSQESLRTGAIAGAIAGGIGLPGFVITSALQAASGVLPGGPFLAEILGSTVYDPALIWVGQLSLGCFLGLFNLIFMAAMATVASAVWFQRSGPEFGDEPLPPAL